MADFLLFKAGSRIDLRTRPNFKLACHLAVAGNHVTILLVQNGVSPARPGSTAESANMAVISMHLTYPAQVTVRIM